MTALRRVDENWAEGKIDNQKGIFPLSFVELNDAAKALLGARLVHSLFLSNSL